MFCVCVIRKFNKNTFAKRKFYYTTVLQPNILFLLIICLINVHKDLPI